MYRKRHCKLTIFMLGMLASAKVTLVIKRAKGQSSGTIVEQSN